MLTRIGGSSFDFEKAMQPGNPGLDMSIDLEIITHIKGVDRGKYAGGSRQRNATATAESCIRPNPVEVPS